jgi:hypothetical protein
MSGWHDNSSQKVAPQGRIREPTKPFIRLGRSNIVRFIYSPLLRSKSNPASAPAIGITGNIALDISVQHRIHPRQANVLFAAMIAAVIVVPLPAAAFCAPAGGPGCCCKSHDVATGNSLNGCHRTAARDKYVSRTCVRRTCGCQRAPEPRSTSPEGPTCRIPTGPVAFLPADAAAFHGGVEFASAFDAARDSFFTAIPHRILHCSWLI